MRLHYFDYAAQGVRTPPPVVCLPGLTRPADDFSALAPALAAKGHRVLALDHRGRGDSAWDPDWSHYSLDVEQDDILRLLALEEIGSAVFVGTSRGGLHAMRLALARPGLVRAAVLNDIGPEINLAGLLAIKRYVGKLPPLNNLADAIGLMRLSAGATFSALSMDEWEQFARQSFVEKDGKVVLRYDPALTRTLDHVAPDMVPELFWDEFAALARGPLLTLRGENSDILTPEILERMVAAAPAMETHTVAGQGHPPLLLDAPTIDRVVAFVAAHV